ncbi:hypothetical protein IQ22_02615 [Pseudomonas duriflava]|uniref:Phosphodiesterase n=1 Tax=Pseudomonas duriflava TaxID=459528 RepID=A0A562Q9E4_9PSED|nr:phosphodiesterase [Pseudomonas duriflava]TWI53401.1 hypothetical protein IQ22_02615 [Pseudomonas duriflava]
MKLTQIIVFMAAMPIATIMAETISIPISQQGDQRIVLPRPGESQSAVLERFGLPDEEHPAVGNPPITRWDYRTFSVYFENKHVINSVRDHHSSIRRDTP